MNVASLDLCKELYELSGWKDTRYTLLTSPVRTGISGRVRSRGDTTELVDWRGSEHNFDSPPAYDLGYLMRKLPRTYAGVGLSVRAAGSSDWIAEYDAMDGHRAIAKTPEDAAARLAVGLFKRGTLTKDQAA